MFEALCDDSQGQCLNAGYGFIAVLAVSQDTGERRDFGEPATIILTFDFDGERHAGNVPSAQAVSQAAKAGESVSTKL
jgi:hypothetical protein